MYRPHGSTRYWSTVARNPWGRCSSWPRGRTSRLRGVNVGVAPADVGNLPSRRDPGVCRCPALYPGAHGFRNRTSRHAQSPSTGPSATSRAPPGGSRWSATTSRPATSPRPSRSWNAGRGGREGRRAARRHRHRQVGDHGLADREAAAADAGDGAEQDAGRAAGQRAAGVVPAQRGRVLRLLLRLLPARGVRPADGHLHREGLLDQRRRRAAAALGDACPAVPPRRDRGGVGVVHLRPRHPAVVPGPVAASRGRRRDARDALLRALVDIQYTRNDMSFTRGSFRVRGDTVEIIPAYEELAIRIEFFGDEIEALYYLHPLTGDVVREVDSLRIFPATHYVAGPGADGERRSRPSRPNSRSGSPSWKARASCWRRSGCGCAPTTTSR